MSSIRNNPDLTVCPKNGERVIVYRKRNIDSSQTPYPYCLALDLKFKDQVIVNDFYRFLERERKREGETGGGGVVVLDCE